MNIADIDARYQAMDDGELLALAVEPDQLTTEAQLSLRNELARRRINPDKISSELREEVEIRSKPPKRSWNPGAIYSLIPELKWVVARIKDWRTYKRRTGHFPVVSIFAYVFHLGLALCLIVAVVVYAGNRHWPKWEFLGSAVVLLIVEGYLSDVMLGRTRMWEIARYRSKRTRM